MRGPVPHLPRVGSRAFCTVLPTLTARPRPSGLPRRGRRHPLGSPLPPRWLPDVAALQLESFLPHAGRVLIAVKRKLRVRLRFGDGCLDKLWLSDPTSVSVHASVDSTSGKVQAQGMAPCSRNRLLASNSDSSSSLLLLNGNQLQWHAMALAVEDVVALSCSELPTQPSSSEVDSACGDYAADALVDAVPGERGDS